MKIIVFGGQTIVARMKSIVNEDNIEVIEAVVRNGSVPEESLHTDDIDLVVVEGNEEDISGLFNNLRQVLSEVPVALIVNKNQADWTKANSVDADGYLSLESSNAVIKARMKAIMRSSVPVFNK